MTRNHFLPLFIFLSGSRRNCFPDLFTVITELAFLGLSGRAVCDLQIFGDEKAIQLS